MEARLGVRHYAVCDRLTLVLGPPERRGDDPAPGGRTLVQGCSTLWDAEKVEEVIDAADGSAEAVLRE